VRGLPSTCGVDVLTDALGVDQPVGHPGGLGDGREGDGLAAGDHVVQYRQDFGPLGLAVAETGCLEDLGGTFAARAARSA
jgi:hypothetical protein